MSSADAQPVRPRAVLDSNVIISGFAFPRGNPAELLELLRLERIRVFISHFIFEEVSRVWRGRFDWEETRVEEALLFLRTYCTVIDPPPQASVAALTPQDNRILDCAVEGGAEYLVTGDKGILQIKDYQGIAIVSPAEFLGIVLQQS